MKNKTCALFLWLETVHLHRSSSDTCASRGSFLSLGGQKTSLHLVHRTKLLPCETSWMKDGEHRTRDDPCQMRSAPGLCVCVWCCVFLFVWAGRQRWEVSLEQWVEVFDLAPAPPTSTPTSTCRRNGELCITSKHLQNQANGRIRLWLSADGAVFQQEQVEVQIYLAPNTPDKEGRGRKKICISVIS